MNLKVSRLGAEPKKLAVLGGCVLVATYFYFSNRPSGDSGSSASVSSSRAVPAAEAPAPLQRKIAKLRRGAQSNASLDFHPTLRFKEGDIDRAKIDPTLRLDLLDRVQNVKIEGVNRSLFDVLAAPPVEMAKIQEPGKIIPKWEPFGPPPPPKPQVVAKAPEPPAPPIPLKFYGFINPVKSATDKRAFFLDGDDIIVANEGQLVKSRYKIVRIGVNSADVEDTQFKNNKQTLPLVKEEQSSS